VDGIYNKICLNIMQGKQSRFKDCVYFSFDTYVESCFYLPHTDWPKIFWMAQGHVITYTSILTEISQN
jgi:hypothetical protein